MRSELTDGKQLGSAGNCAVRPRRRCVALCSPQKCAVASAVTGYSDLTTLIEYLQNMIHEMLVNFSCT